MEYRSVSVRAGSIDDEARSVEATLSSETPVLMFDWQRWEYVPEVLLTSGMQVPRNKQVPLLDSHDRSSMSRQLGSVRDIRKEDTASAGMLVYSSVHENEWTKVREGHATDVSVGYQVIERKYIPEGKSKTIKGRVFEGPVNLVTKWRLSEVSQTPIGADEQAKLRGFDPADLPRGFFDPASPPQRRKYAMDSELRALLEELGLDAEAEDDTAQRFLVDNADRIRAAFVANQPTTPDNGRTHGSDGAATQGEDLAAAVRRLTQRLDEHPNVEETIQRALAERDQQRAVFRENVDGLCELAGITDETFVRSLYDQADEAAVRQAILDHRAERSQGLDIGHQPMRTGAAQRDKLRSAMGTALIMRSFNRCQVMNPNSPHVRAREEITEQIFPAAQRAADWEHFQYATLLDIARECLRMDGYDLRGLNNDDVAMVALGFGDQIGIRSSDPAFHTTGSFPFIVQDAMNKSMMLGYVEFPSTWQMVMTVGDAVPDFKTIHRMQIGALPNLPIWDGKSVPGDVSHKDEEETYAVECRSAKLSFDYKLLVNNDMGVISRQPQKFGDAAARTVNAVAWAQITGNPTMRDGQALFLETPAGNRKRQNLTTGAGAPSSTTIGALTNLMMQMRGSNTPEEDEGQDILALMPRYIVGPSALRTTILKEVRSIADPNGTHAGEANLSNDLIPVIEPLLDASSTTAWYLFAETNRVETVEVTFLQGQEQPRVRTVMNADRLSQDHYVLQTFEAKALDHRGMQKHAGA